MSAEEEHPYKSAADSVLAALAIFVLVSAFAFGVVVFELVAINRRLAVVETKKESPE